MSLFRVILPAMFLLFLTLDFVYIFIAKKSNDGSVIIAGKSITRNNTVLHELLLKSCVIKFISGDKYKIALITQEHLDGVVLQLTASQSKKIKEEIVLIKSAEGYFLSDIHLSKLNRYVLNLKGYKEKKIFFKKIMLHFDKDELKIK